MSLGAKPITEETACSYCIGALFELTQSLNLTLDYFDRAIDDRISLTGNIVITAELGRILDEADLLAGVENLAEAKFFSNDLDSRTREKTRSCRGTGNSMVAGPA